MAQEIIQLRLVRWNLLDHQFGQPSWVFYCSPGVREWPCELFFRYALPLCPRCWQRWKAGEERMAINTKAGSPSCAGRRLWLWLLLFPSPVVMKRLLILRRCEPIVRFTCCSVRYGECRRNHAASTGGYAIDGCREFIADGEEGTGGALKCAACGCHRSFHRRVQVYEVSWDYASSDTSSTE